MFRQNNSIIFPLSQAATGFKSPGRRVVDEPPLPVLPPWLTSTPSSPFKNLLALIQSTSPSSTQEDLSPKALASMSTSTEDATENTTARASRYEAEI